MEGKQRKRYACMRACVHLPVGHVGVPGGALGGEAAREDDRLLLLQLLDAGQRQMDEIGGCVRLVK